MTSDPPDLPPDPQPGRSGPTLPELLASVERDLAHSQRAVTAGKIVDLTPMLGPIGDFCSRIETLDRDTRQSWLSAAEAVLEAINRLEAAMASSASAPPDSPDQGGTEKQAPEARSRFHRAYASAAMVQTDKQGR